jgi:hypothetical protein
MDSGRERSLAQPAIRSQAFTLLSGYVSASRRENVRAPAATATANAVAGEDVERLSSRR